MTSLGDASVRKLHGLPGFTRFDAVNKGVRHVVMPGDQVLALPRGQAALDVKNFAGSIGCWTKGGGSL